MNKLGLPIVPSNASSDRRAALSATWAHYGWAAIGALVIAWFAIYNGYPVIYQDTVGYLQRPAQAFAKYGWTSEWSYVRPAEGRSDRAIRAWMAGRSVYYGSGNAALAALATTGAVIYLQAYIVAASIAIPLRRLGWRASGYIVAVALLSVATTVSVYASALLPDILMPVAILDIAMLFSLHDRLTWFDRTFLTLTLVYAAVSHDTIWLLIGVALLPTLLWALLRAGRWLIVVPLLLATLAGFGGAKVFDLAGTVATGEAPLRLPHLTARLATSDLGRRYMADHCPQSGFLICRYRAQAGQADWIQFLFSRKPAIGVYQMVDTPLRRVLSDEQLAFALAVLAYDPIAFAQLQVSSIGRQLVGFSLHDLHMSNKGAFFRDNLSPRLFAAVMETRSVTSGDRVMRTLSSVSMVASILSAALLLAIWWRIRREPLQRATMLAILLVAGILLNAVICATLAGVYDRFQARVIWLLPLAAMVMLARDRGLPLLPVRKIKESELV